MGTRKEIFRYKIREIDILMLFCIYICNFLCILESVFGTDIRDYIEITYYTCLIKIYILLIRVNRRQCPQISA